MKGYKQIKFIIVFIIISVILIMSPFRNWMIDNLESQNLSYKTLKELKEHDYWFSHFANQYNVPNGLIKAAVGSEINRRIYINRVTDFLQDQFFASSFWCSEGLLKESLHSSINIRYLNITKQDIGIGNINFSSAWKMVLCYPHEFPEIETLRDLAKYLLTVKGNIHVATVILLDGLKWYTHLTSDHNLLQALAFSYYKEGENFFYRYLKNSDTKCRPPIPHPKGIQFMAELKHY